MIAGFKHKGLKRLYEADDARNVNPQHIDKIKLILGVLDVAAVIADVDTPSFRLHPLTGDLKGFWSMTVRSNWRIVFCFEMVGRVKSA